MKMGKDPKICPIYAGKNILMIIYNKKDLTRALDLLTIPKFSVN